MTIFMEIFGSVHANVYGNVCGNFKVVSSPDLIENLLTTAAAAGKLSHHLGDHCREEDEDDPGDDVDDGEDGDDVDSSHTTKDRLTPEHPDC